MEGASPEGSQCDECKWEERVKAYHVPRSDINKVVMEYLVKEGFKDAVMMFQRETGVSPGVDMSTLDNQIKIRAAIETGKIQESIELINEVDPEILDTDAKLFFHLQQQQLLEFIRLGDTESVLKFARSELSARGEENPEFLNELEQSLALLAFEDMSACPFADLLQYSQRLKVVSEVNAALLSSQDQVPTSRLDTLMKMVLWAQDQLEKKGVSFPTLQGIASGKLQKDGQ